MEQFSYSFAVSMLHSIWQMAVLLLFYFFFKTVLQKSHPAFKRNILFGLLGLQLFITLVTFLFYYNNTFGRLTNSITTILYAPPFNQVWLQSYARYIFYAYIFIISYKIIGLLYNCISFKMNFSKYVVKPPVDIKMFTILKAQQFGIKRKVSIWYSKNVFTPLTFGFFKPIILMPVALLNGLTLPETESLIIHELTHIKNNDYLLNWLLMMIETIYFFNPFLKIIVAKIKSEREKSCDATVIQFNYSSLVYARALLKIAQQTQQHKRFQLAAVFNRSQLLHRIHFFSGEKNQQFSKKNYAIFFAFAMLAVFILNVFLIAQIKNNNKSISATTYQVANKMAERQTKVIDNFNSENVVTMVQKIRSTKKLAKQLQEKSLLTKDIIQRHQPEIKTSPVNNNYAIPASLKKEEPVISKEVLLNEENSSGKIVTQAYRVQLKNGRWVAEPLWMTSEIKLPNDSIKQKGDTVLYHIIDKVQ